MPIEFEVTDLNTIEEEIRVAYVEKDGKHILDPERFYEVKAASLIKKNQELIGDKKKLSESLAAAERKGAGTAGDIERQLTEKDARIAELEQSNREHAIWSPIQALAAKSGVVPTMIGPLMTILRAEKRFDMEEGKIVYKGKTGYDTGISPQRAFDVYLREELPNFFEASRAAGSGAQNGGKGGAGARTITRDSFESMSEAAKSQALKDGARIID